MSLLTVGHGSWRPSPPHGVLRVWLRGKSGPAQQSCVSAVGMNAEQKERRSARVGRGIEAKTLRLLSVASRCENDIGSR